MGVLGPRRRRKVGGGGAQRRLIVAPAVLYHYTNVTITITSTINTLLYHIILLLYRYCYSHTVISFYYHI